jgi:hypothetical protein
MNLGITRAADLDAMSPAERHEDFQQRIVWDLDDLPPEYVAALRAEQEAVQREQEGSRRAS